MLVPARFPNTCPQKQASKCSPNEEDGCGIYMPTLERGFPLSFPRKNCFFVLKWNSLFCFVFNC